jgi:hypothetical protein
MTAHEQTIIAQAREIARLNELAGDLAVALLEVDEALERLGSHDDEPPVPARAAEPHELQFTCNAPPVLTVRAWSHSK